jgi:hypothetical protein
LYSGIERCTHSQLKLVSDGNFMETDMLSSSKTVPLESLGWSFLQKMINALATPNLKLCKKQAL